MGIRTITALIMLVVLVSCAKTPFEPEYRASELGIHTIDGVREYMAGVPVTGCIQACNIAEQLCWQLGYSTMRVNLWREYGNVGHQVLLAWKTSGQYYLFTNNESGYIPVAEWRVPVMEYFGNAYDTAEIDRIYIHNQGGVE